MPAKKDSAKYRPQPGPTDVASLKLLRSDAHGTQWVFTEQAESSQVHSTMWRRSMLAQRAEHAGSTSTSTSMEPVPTGGKLGFIEATSPGQCVGTLRWDESSRFPRLPAWPASLVGDEAPLPEGWRSYLEMRLLPDAGGVIRVEPPMLDGLSYPLSLLHAMRLLRLRPPSHETLTVLIIGSSSKAEARLLRDSNCAQ